MAALAAIASLVVNHLFHTDTIAAWVSCVLYLAAPIAIVRHLLRQAGVDSETVMGAIAAYLMAGMFFAFLYRAVGGVQSHPFFGAQGPGTFPQDLFFSFTTLTTTGYGDLTPAWQPWPVVRGARDGDRPAVPGHRGGQGRQQLASRAGQERAAGGARRSVTLRSSIESSRFAIIPTLRHTT